MIDRTTPPALSSFKDLRLTFPALTRLDNGIPCYIIKGGDDEMNRIYIYLHGGALMEDKPAQAILTAMLLTEGTTGMTAQQVAEQFDFYGVRKSGDSYDYWSETVMTSLNHNFSDTMQLMYRCITAPSFPLEELEVLKRRIAGNLSILQQRVRYLASVRMKQLYYGENHPLGRNIMPQDIMAITRDDLLDFQRKYFNAANCQIIIAGKIDDNVMATVNGTLGQWSDNSTPIQPPAWSITPSPLMLDIVDYPGAMQSALRIRIVAVKREHSDYLPLRVLITLFGGYFGSRLMMNIREDKGYTYGIQASLLGIEHDGCIDIQCECATEHTWNVIKEVKNEMRRLREELIPDNELNTVRQHMLSAMAKTHDTPYNIAGYVTSTLLFGVYPEYHNDQLDCVNNITPQTLRELARKYLTDDLMRIVIAGDKTELEKIKPTA